MRVALNIDTNHMIDHLRGITNSSAKLRADSRQIEPGDIFLAYPVGHGNAKLDGRQYIQAALEQGAAAVIFDPNGFDSAFTNHPLCFAVPNLSIKAGELCSQWYGFPSKQLKMIGVTGTNGKTSITQWLAQALNTAAHRAAVLGTLGTGFPESLIQTGYTTPDAPKLQTQLKELLDAHWIKQT